MAFWIPLLAVVALTTVATMLLNKPQQSPLAAAEKFEVPTADEGGSIPILFGTRRIKAANVLWYGDVKSVAIRKKGGKK